MASLYFFDHMSIHVTWMLSQLNFASRWSLTRLCNRVCKAVFCAPCCEMQRATAFFGLLIHDTVVHLTSSSTDLALPGEFALHASCFRKLRETRSIVNLVLLTSASNGCSGPLNSARHANAPGLLLDGNLADCVRIRVQCRQIQIPKVGADRNEEIIPANRLTQTTCRHYTHLHW